MFDVECEFFGTQRRQSALQCCDIEGRLTAEMLMDHPGICPRLLNNTADAPAGEAMRREFRGGCTQDFLAALLRGPAGAPPRRRFSPPPGRVLCAGVNNVD